MTTPEFVAAWASAPGRSPEAVLGWTASLSDVDWAAADASRRERWPGDAPVDLEAIAAASFPKVFAGAPGDRRSPRAGRAWRG